MTTSRKRMTAAGAALLLFASCSGPAPQPEADRITDEPGWDETAAELRTCPSGDDAWRRALTIAQQEDKLEALLSLSDDLTAECAARWEPAWSSARVLFRLRRIAEAQERSSEALRRARALTDETGIACSANLLGAFAYFAGNLDEGEGYYRDALAGAEARGRRDLESRIRNNLAGLLLEKGELASAREELELAEKGLNELGLEAAARGAAFNRAVILLEFGDATGSREVLEKVYAEAQQAGDQRTLDTSAVVLGNLHLMLEETESAAGWLRRVSEENMQYLALAEIGLGRIELLAGRFEAAAQLFERAAGRAREQFVADALLADTFLAETKMRAGEHTALISNLEAVIDESDAIDAELTAWAARSILGKHLSAVNRDAAAIPILERAVAILEAQGAGLDPLGDGLRFLRERFDPYVDLALAVARGGEPAGREERILQIVAMAQARALRHELNMEGETSAVSVSTLQGSLRKGELLLNYLLGEDRGIVLAIDRMTARAHPIEGRAALFSHMRRFRDSLRDDSAAPGLDPEPEPGSPAADAGSDGDAGELLREALLAPVADLVERAGRLYIIPDRELALLPFAALPWPSKDDRSSDDRVRLLGEKIEIAVQPMAGTPPRWVGRRTPVLLAGRPELGADSEFSELPWSAYELSRLGEVWPDGQSRYLGGADLNLTELRSIMENFPTVHLSTHAVASTRDPRRSGVILSDGDRLDLDAILDLELDDALVVLSACRTGEGELVQGEGVIGLSWAFLRAGAKGIVASRWSVDDTGTARLMVAFHRQLKEGADPITALARARRDLAAAGVAPSLWAPFVIIVRPG